VVQAFYCDANMTVKAAQLWRENRSNPIQNAVEQDNAGLIATEAQLDKDKANLVVLEYFPHVTSYLAAAK
jgi:hypothetical protein